MRLRSCAVPILLALLAACSGAASLSDAHPLSSREPLLQPDLLSRDGHAHHAHNAAPLLELNETEVTMYHAPTPPSYFTIDWDDSDSSEKRYPGLIMSHAIFMGLAFFVALPAGMLARRRANSAPYKQSLLISH
ncbi:hypothetical protein BDQ17DRAFT_1349193 [Cyathus striatus]|nr:hypothetical protein BDQ17DRAFT_1349193 [Cyathus striatus]